MQAKLRDLHRKECEEKRQQETENQATAKTKKNYRKLTKKVRGQPLGTVQSSYSIFRDMYKPTAR